MPVPEYEKPGEGVVQVPQDEVRMAGGGVSGCSDICAARRVPGASLISGARCPQGSQESQLVCLGESRAAEEHATDGTEGTPGSRPWAGGGGGGGGATYVFRVCACFLEVRSRP